MFAIANLPSIAGAVSCLQRTRYCPQCDVLYVCCVSHQARLACSFDAQCLPCLHVLQTEEASDKLREVMAPMASQFSTALTPLKSAVSLKSNLRKWECRICCCIESENLWICLPRP